MSSIKYEQPRLLSTARPRRTSRGQTSVEIILITALVLTFIVGILSDTAQLNDTTAAIAIAKAHTLKLLSEEDEFYFLIDVLPSELAEGRNKLTLDIRISGPEFDPPNGPPPGFAALRTKIQTEVENKIEATGIYETVVVNVEGV